MKGYEHIPLVLRKATIPARKLGEFAASLHEQILLNETRPPWQPVCPTASMYKMEITAAESALQEFETACALDRTDDVRNRSKAPELSTDARVIAKLLQKVRDELKHSSEGSEESRCKTLRDFLRMADESPALIDRVCRDEISELRIIVRQGGPRQFAVKSALAFARVESTAWFNHRQKQTTKYGEVWKRMEQLFGQELTRIRELPDRGARKEPIESVESSEPQSVIRVRQSWDRARTAEEDLRAAETAAISAVMAPWSAARAICKLERHASPVLSDEDKQLARAWASSKFNTNETFWKDAMCSARRAERVACLIYKRLHGEAEDLSVLQVRNIVDGRWQKADINAGGHWIDVKNARRSYSSPATYSEYSVPEFKKDREDQDVVLSGFLSPYKASDGGAIVWMGETTLSHIRELEREFKTPCLSLGSDLHKTTLPPWIFDFPTISYSERDASVQRIRSQSFNWPLCHCPIGTAVLAGRIAQLRTDTPIEREAAALALRFAIAKHPTRAHLYLHILTRFCEATRADSRFAAAELRQILFPAEPEFSTFVDDTNPLAISDPLSCIKSLLDTLESVSQKCCSQTMRFSAFRLKGPHVLQGRTENGTWQTIIAYCGGWRRLENGRHVKCGKSPLHLAANEPCEACKRLVCNECRFCSSDCPMNQNAHPNP